MKYANKFVLPLALSFFMGACGDKPIHNHYAVKTEEKGGIERIETEHSVKYVDKRMYGMHKAYGDDKLNGEGFDYFEIMHFPRTDEEIDITINVKEENPELSNSKYQNRIFNVKRGSKYYIELSNEGEEAIKIFEVSGDILKNGSKNGKKNGKNHAKNK